MTKRAASKRRYKQRRAERKKVEEAAEVAWRLARLNDQPLNFITITVPMVYFKHTRSIVSTINIWEK